MIAGMSFLNEGRVSFSKQQRRWTPPIRRWQLRLVIDLHLRAVSMGWAKMTQELRGALIALAMAAVVFAVAVGIAQPMTIFH
jgi:hypothetical protein